MARSLETDLDDQLRRIHQQNRKVRRVENCEHKRLLEVAVVKKEGVQVRLMACATEGCPYTSEERVFRA